MKRLSVFLKVIVAVLILSSCASKSKINEDITLSLKVTHLEWNEPISTEELMKLVEIKGMREGTVVSLDSEPPRIGDIGQYPCQFKFEYEGDVVFKVLNIEVKDTKAPVFVRTADAFIRHDAVFSPSDWIVMNEEATITFELSEKNGNIENYVISAVDGSGNTATTTLRVTRTGDNGVLSAFEHFGQTYGSKKANVDKKNAMLVNKQYQLSESYTPDNLIAIAPGDSYYGTALQLEATTYEAFKEMNKTMMEETGIERMTILSAYRSYQYQATLYNNYVAKDGVLKADRYSARPGYSEHQTGLALDLATGTRYLDAFNGTPQALWVSENAHRFGFVVRYQEMTESITGYKAEPWHIRYLGEELANKVFTSGLTYDEYYVLNLMN